MFRNEEKALKLFPKDVDIVKSDIFNIDQIIENNYKIKYISDSKHSEIRNILINSNTNNAVKYDIDINIETTGSIPE